jgi:hypothetical protein
MAVATVGRPRVQARIAILTDSEFEMFAFPLKVHPS